MEHTLALIEKAHEGDKAARDTLAEENMGLVWSMVRRFANRGVEMEDLCQIGSIGLLKAIDKFDPSFEVCFFDVCGSDDCGGDPAVSAVGGDGEGEPPDPGTGVESVCGAGAAGAGERARSDAGGDSGGA